MSKRYDDWMRDSQQWRDKLDKALEQHGGEDVFTEYSNVAYAFPSREPHLDSFDFPMIDEKGLFQWAKSKGYEVQLAHDKAADEDKHSPPIRFTKK